MNALNPVDSLFCEPRPQDPEDLARWLSDLVSLLRRQRWLIAACLAAALAAALAYLLSAAPGYTAATTLLIDSQRADVFRQQLQPTDAQILNAQVETEVEVLRSPGLALKVVDSLGLADDPSFNRPPSALASLAAALRARLHPAAADGQAGNSVRERAARQLLTMVVARRVGLTYVVEVDVTAAAPTEAARLANGIAAAYLAEQLAARRGSMQEAAEWLRQHLEALRQQSLDADQGVQAFKGRSGIVDANQGPLDRQQLGELQSQLVAARGRRTEARARTDRLQAVLDSPGGAAADGATLDLLQNPVVSGLRQRYLDDARLEAEWSARYGHGHAAAAKLRQDMAELQLSLHQEVARVVQAARNEEQIAAADEAAISAQLASLVGQAAATGDSRAALRSLESSAEIYRALYTRTLQQYTQSAQDQSFPVAGARVVSPATPPPGRSSPRTVLVLAAAVVAGLGLGFALALGREMLDHGLHDAEQVEAELALPCLAVLRGAGAQGARGRRAARDAVRFARETGRLRRRCLQHLGEGGRGVLAVAGARPGDGAGATALSLARALTAGGRRVALVTAAEIAPVAAGGGVTLVRASAAAGLARPLLDGLRRDYAVLVLDLPAAERIDDPCALLAAIDGLVVVARQGRTEAGDVARCLADLGVERRRVLGVVLAQATGDGGTRGTQPAGAA